MLTFDGNRRGFSRLVQGGNLTITGLDDALNVLTDSSCRTRQVDEQLCANTQRALRAWHCGESLYTSFLERTLTSVMPRIVACTTMSLLRSECNRPACSCERATKQWNNAVTARKDQTGIRQARDGQPYSYAKFALWYGHSPWLLSARWAEAALLSKPGAGESLMRITSDKNFQSDNTNSTNEVVAGVAAESAEMTFPYVEHALNDVIDEIDHIEPAAIVGAEEAAIVTQQQWAGFLARNIDAAVIDEHDFEQISAPRKPDKVSITTSSSGGVPPLSSTATQSEGGADVLPGQASLHDLAPYFIDCRLPSLGTVSHGSGECTACRTHTRGKACKFGTICEYCHGFHIPDAVAHPGGHRRQRLTKRTHGESWHRPPTPDPFA